MSLREKQAKQKKLAIEVASILFHYKWIAHSIGISERTLHNWKDKDKDFCNQLNQERSAFISKNIKKARAEFLLQTADRETFGEKKEVEVKLNPAKKILELYGITNLKDMTDGMEDTTGEKRPSK